MDGCTRPHGRERPGVHAGSTMQAGAPGRSVFHAGSHDKGLRHFHSTKMRSLTQCGAKANAARCDDRCSALQQPMQRVASSDAAKHDGCFTETHRLFRLNSQAVLPHLANHFVVSCGPLCHISQAALPYLIICFTTQPRDEKRRSPFSASDFHTPIIYIRCMLEPISD